MAESILEYITSEKADGKYHVLLSAEIEFGKDQPVVKGLEIHSNQINRGEIKIDNCIADELERLLGAYITKKAYEQFAKDLFASRKN